MTILQLTLLGFFHWGIFILIGLFYWMWSVVVFALGVLLFQITPERSRRIFNRRNFWIGICVISFLIYFNYDQTLGFGWWHVKYEYKYIYQAETKSGKTYSLAKDNWTPYDYYFLGYSSFYQDYRLQRQIPPFSDYEWARKLNKLLASEDVSLSEIKRIYGRSHYNETKNRRFKTFIRRMAINRLENPSPIANYLEYVAPPQILGSHSTEKTYYLSEIPGMVQKINVFISEALYEDGRYKAVKRRKLYSIKLNQF